MSHSSLHSALLRVGALYRSETSLHECKGKAWQYPAWGDAVHDLHFLVNILTGGLPNIWFQIEAWSPGDYALDVVRNLGSYTVMLRTRMG
jgi:hypothetical protein